MLFADWILGTSSTGGTGALTLAAVTGWPSYADALGSSGVRVVVYCIEEYTDSTLTILLRAEDGIGLLNLATGVLTRQRPLATWNGTTYSSTNAAALSFGTTAANIRVRCSLIATLPTPMAPPFTQTTYGDAMGHPGLNASLITSAFQVLTANIYFVPTLWQGGDVDLIGVYCTIVSNNSAIKIGVYEVGTDGLPGRLLVDATGASPITTATTGVRTLAVSFSLPPGWYYTAILANNSPSLRSNTATGSPSTFAGTSAGLNIQHLTHAQTYANGLPNPRTAALTAATTGGPRVFMRRRN